jgi:AcrR family transcriptional regulator
MNALAHTQDSLSTRARILDAAERVVGTSGAAHLTLDAVVQQADISKGGLLYHFNSKQALLAAMLDRYCERIDAEMEAGLRQHGNTLEGHVLAQLGAYLDLHKQHGAVGTALLAAMAANPALMHRPRKHLAALIAAMLRQPGDQDLALLATYAISGIVLNEMLGLDVLDQARRPRLKTKLRELAEQSSRAPSTKRANL